MPDETAVAAQKQARERDFERIEVEIEDKNGRTRTTAFEGAWLVEEDKFAHRQYERDKRPAGGIYSVVLTKRNAIVVIGYGSDGILDEEDLCYFPSFNALLLNLAPDNSSHRYPPSLIAAVAAELGLEYVEELHW